MSSQWQQDNAFDALKKHSDTIRAAAGSNEDTTRVRAIDTLLFDVLGWDKTLVETERYCRDEGYADYAFRQSTSLCLIVEAKRDGATFVLPNTKTSDRPIGFGLLGSQSKDAASAYRQACGYASSEGARYVAITNGHQWIFGLAFVQGQPIDERSVFVFNSFDDITGKFSQFWDCFSQDGVYSNACAVSLLESRKAPAPSKLSTQIPGYPQPANRNVILNDLEVVIGLVWDQMDADETEEHFLRECYIHPDASAENLDEAKELIERRHDTDIAVTYEAFPTGDLSTLIETYHSEKPVVVLGRIGHGKSTFLRYMRLIGAAEALKNYIQVEINFLDRPDHPNEVSDYIYGQIENQLATTYGIDVEDDKIARAALHGDLNRFKKTPEAKVLKDSPKEYAMAELRRIKELQSNRHEYFAKVIYHLRKSNNRSIAVFFDNLDRRLDPIQEAAFLRSSAMSRDWSCLVFVCLRPGTFYRSTTGGILDTVAPKTLVVTPPRADALLRKRLQYAASIAEGKSGKDGRPAFGSNVSVHLSGTAEVLNSAAESFYRNPDLRNAMVAICNGNIRDMLRYVRLILTSEHLDTRKIQRKIEETGGYTIALHEALNALLFGDSMNFDPSTSLFANLFDTQYADHTEHFTRLIALNLLGRIPKASPTFGYAKRSDILTSLCQLGYTHVHAENTLEYLYSKRCCEGEILDAPWSAAGENIRITSLGEYHVQVLVRRFEYYDAIVVDTPVIDTDSRSEIKDVRPIKARLDRGEKFIEYLQRASMHLQDAPSIKLVEEVTNAALGAIQQIRPRVEIAYD